MVKNTTSITLYGGVNEIGGNKLLLKDKDTRVFFDFGMSFGMKKLFYAPPFLSPKSEKSLQELGILPKLKEIYRFDSRPTEVDPVFISHAHLDHSAYLSFINRQIPVYCGARAALLLSSSAATRLFFRRAFQVSLSPFACQSIAIVWRCVCTVSLSQESFASQRNREKWFSC